MIEIVTLLIVLILVGLSIFQVALICGAPLGNYAWGGQHAILPASLRIGSVVSILIYTGIVAFVMSKAGLSDVIGSPSVASIGTWIIAAYFTLGILLNGISRSTRERNLMTPIVTILAGLTFVVALS